MRRNSFFGFIFTGVCLISPALFAASGAGKAAGFDLFGMPLSALDQGLGKRAESLSQALAVRFPKDSGVQGLKENSYGGRCFVGGDGQYQVSWMDSETEGFRFTVARMKDPKNCESPFSSTETFKILALQSGEFSPLSNAHPSLRIGVSTLAEVQKEMGPATYSSPSQWAYALKRDTLKEKGCGYNSKKGELAAIMVVFKFDKGILQAIELQNTISGEC